MQNWAVVEYIARKTSQNSECNFYVLRIVSGIKNDVISYVFWGEVSFAGDVCDSKSFRFFTLGVWVFFWLQF